jgi:hypothetical protein
MQELEGNALNEGVEGNELAEEEVEEGLSSQESRMSPLRGES